MSRVSGVEHILKRKRMRKKTILLFTLCGALLYFQNSSKIMNLIKDGYVRQARELLIQSDANNRNPGDIMFLQGLLTADGDSALVLFKKLIQLYPENKFCDDALYRIAQLKYAQGLYKNAMSKFSLIIKNYPGSQLLPRCYYWLGMCHMAMGRQDSAAYNFKLVINRFPDSEISKQIRYDIYMLEGKGKSEDVEDNRFPKIYYSVQVAAFTRQSNALLRKQFFESRGYRVRLESKIKNGKFFYLVWIGDPFEKWEDARRFGEQLKKRFGISYTIVSH